MTSKYFATDTNPEKAFEKVDYDKILKAVKGRKGLRTTKPKTNGLDAYVWRMVRFHAGIDVHMPVTADFDLYNWYTKVIESEKSVSCFDSGLKKFKDYVDKLVDRIIKDLGLDPNKAAHIWGRALGMI